MPYFCNTWIYIKQTGENLKMNKMLAIVMLVLIINISLYLIPYKCDPNTNLDNNNNACEKSSIFNWFLNPIPIKSDSKGVLNVIYTTIAALTGIGIIVGVYYVRSDFPIYAAISSAFLITLISTIVNLWQFIYSYPYIPNPGLKMVIASLIAGTMGVYALFTTLDWARGKV